MSNDRHVVVENSWVNAGNVDMISYWMMNLKWREVGLYMIRIHIIEVSLEWKLVVSCYQVARNVQNMDLTACQAIQKPASQITRGSVSVLCVGPGWASPRRSVSVISDLWRTPWITGQCRHQTSLFCSETLKIRSVWKKKDDKYFPCFTWPSYLVLLWSFADLLVGFLSGGWSDNTRLTPIIM